MGTVLTILTEESAIPFAYSLEADLKWIDTLSTEDKKAKETELEARKKFVEDSIYRVKNPHVLFLTAVRQGLQRLAQYCLPDSKNPFNIPDTFQPVKPVLQAGWQNHALNYHFPVSKNWFRNEPEAEAWGHLFLYPRLAPASEDQPRMLQWVIDHRHITKYHVDFEALFCSTIYHDFNHPDRQYGKRVLSALLSLMKGYYIDIHYLLKRLLSQSQIHHLTDHILRKWYLECTTDHVICALQCTNKEMVKKIRQALDIRACSLVDAIKTIDACRDLDDFNVIYSFSGLKITILREVLPIIKHFLENLKPNCIDWIFQQNELICSAATQLNECRMWFVRYHAIKQLSVLVAYANTEKFQNFLNGTIIDVDSVLPLPLHEAVF